MLTCQIVSVTKLITVQNHLIVSMGDSIASGEGNPDSVNEQNELQPLRWVDRRCHRSGWSWHAQSAAGVATSKASVTFLSVACSGAGIQSGVLGPYAGEENYQNFGDLAPQLDDVAEVLCPANKPDCYPNERRNIDALLIQAGANDAGFGDAVHTCANPFTECWNNATLVQSEQDKLEALPGLYTNLQQRIASKGLHIGKTFIAEYPNLLHGDDGKICSDIWLEGAVADNKGSWVNWFQEGDGDIDAAESTWAEQNIVNPLNAIVQNAAAANGWTFVSGVSSKFLTHGYCASPQDRWVRHYLESKSIQGNEKCALHPNITGHFQYRLALDAVLKPFIQTPPPTSCGNFMCEPGETSSSCPGDCPCGDLDCSGGETMASCPEDCTPRADGVCVSVEDGTADCNGWHTACEPGTPPPAWVAQNNTCVKAIVNNFPTCGTTWSDGCVQKVEEVCGSFLCTATPSQVGFFTTKPQPANLFGSYGKSFVVNAVCASDPYCCQTNWDSICVDEAACVVEPMVAPGSTFRPGSCGTEPPRIWVRQATYGGNCGAPTGNQTLALGAKVDGNTSYTYNISATNIGDPAPGCAKTYAVTYNCLRAGATKTATIAAEATGTSVTLSCP
jgi:hypothetical protein